MGSCKEPALESGSGLPHPPAAPITDLRKAQKERFAANHFRGSCREHSKPLKVFVALAPLLSDCLLCSFFTRIPSKRTSSLRELHALRLLLFRITTCSPKRIMRCCKNPRYRNTNMHSGLDRPSNPGIQLIYIPNARKAQPWKSIYFPGLWGPWSWRLLNAKSRAEMIFGVSPALNKVSDYAE